MATFQCPECRSSDVIQISMSMETGAPVSFYSCHECEHRWWNKDGEPIRLDEVLSLAKNLPKRARRA